MASTKKAISKKQDAFPEVRPDYMAEDSNRGSDGVGAEDLTIPRLSLIQSLSPQRKKSDPAYIDGAEEGLMFNTVTNKLYGDHVFFVPVFFKKSWIIWKDRDAGGGFRGEFDSPEAANAAMGELEDSASCEVTDTAQQFGLILDPAGDMSTMAGEECVLSMSKSQLTPSRKFNSMIRMNGGDRFSRVYKLSAVEVAGAKGDYYNYALDNVGFVPEHIYLQAESLYEAVSAGGKAVNYSDDAKATEDETEF